MRHSAGKSHVLDPLKLADVIEVIEMFREDPDSVYRAMPWLEHNKPIGPQIASFIADVSSGPNASHYHHWIIRDNDEFAALGIIGFDVVRFRTPQQQLTSRGIHWNLGYWILCFSHFLHIFRTLKRGSGPKSIKTSTSN